MSERRGGLVPDEQPEVIDEQPVLVTSPGEASGRRFEQQRLGVSSEGPISPRKPEVTVLQPT